MEYRSLGTSGIEISAVSLGTEYLLAASVEETREVVDGAIAGGVNYVDLFYAQPEFRDRLGEVLEPYRERIMLAAHYGAGEKRGQYERTRDPDRAEAYFADFLKRYRTDHTDVLFCHNCDEIADLESMLAPGGLCDAIEAHRDAGRARIVGFSGHTAATAAAAVETGRFDLLMFPVNVTTHGDPEAEALYDLCLRTGVPIVAMKPYAGGSLVGQDMHVAYEERVASPGGAGAGSAAVRCLAYALSRPGVVAAVPGCASLEHVTDALSWYTADAPARDFSQLLEEHAGTARGQCTYCNHCLPCPSQIDIGSALRFYDTHRGDLCAAPAEVAECIRCGICTRRCPFGVDVVPRMVEMQDALRTGA